MLSGIPLPSTAGAKHSGTYPAHQEVNTAAAAARTSPPTACNIVIFTGASIDRLATYHRTELWHARDSVPAWLQQG